MLSFIIWHIYLWVTGFFVSLFSFLCWVVLSALCCSTRIVTRSVFPRPVSSGVSCVPYCSSLSACLPFLSGLSPKRPRSINTVFPAFFSTVFWPWLRWQSFVFHSSSRTIYCWTGWTRRTPVSLSMAPTRRVWRWSFVSGTVPITRWQAFMFMAGTTAAAVWPIFPFIILKTIPMWITSSVSVALKVFCFPVMRIPVLRKTVFWNTARAMISRPW